SDGTENRCKCMFFNAWRLVHQIVDKFVSKSLQPPDGPPWRTGNRIRGLRRLAAAVLIFQ
ncbi:hypothetical protein, partial [Klebsiella pneumoniae]|uniref:hypothetical protein n=1 Tax=Klebsiella pneumoniae TaxID=573 RepID=UPI0039C3E9F3